MAFAIYFLLLLLIILRGSRITLFHDEIINRKNFTFFFILKVLAIPAFYFLFLKLYGGIEKFDAGKFFFDAKTIGNFAFQNFPEYVKTIFGLQDETEGGHFYKMIIEPTFNWENGAEKDFFYNDNRVVIRIHAIIHLIAFNSYFVHALWACFFSYIGSVLIYKSLKNFFPGKEKLFFVLICFFPSLWLYTGALLKEPWCVFFFGSIIYTTKQLTERGFSIKRILAFAFLLLVSIMLKPYILFFGLISFLLFYAIQTKVIAKWRIAVFTGAILVLALTANLTVLQIKKISLYDVAVGRLLRFDDVAKGGIFLTDTQQLIRVDYDWNLLSKDSLSKNHFKLKKGTPYVYWEFSHKNDTLRNYFNTNTTSSYSLAYVIPKAGSNIQVKQNNAAYTLLNSLYYTMAYPLFVNAKGAVQYLASFENLILLLSVLLIISGCLSSSKEKFPTYFFLFLSLSIFMLIGFTTPNSGAILRYRAPMAIFLLAGALYFVDFFKIKQGKLRF
ncbi:MAG: hypothetical protein IPM51_12820 [Sphingobacteriaceae bacterium]|nr:hypothetical protein [Sphingobacteriaceae bacterium]